MVQPAGHHLAELNIARLVADQDDPRVAEFMDNIDRINGLGARMPGFVWIMSGDGSAGNTGTHIGGDPRFIPNLTVWDSAPRLYDFVFNTLHKRFFDKRAEWFEVLGQPHFVMWWVPEGHEPSLDEALERLEHLRSHGASAMAFDWGWLRAQGLLTPETAEA